MWRQVSPDPLEKRTKQLEEAVKTITSLLSIIDEQQATHDAIYKRQQARIAELEEAVLNLDKLLKERERAL